MAGPRHLLVAFLSLGAACTSGGGRRSNPVTPSDIPLLEQQVARRPTDAGVRLRLAAALMAAERCDTAVQVARAAQALAPREALGPMVIGGCHERAGRYDLAHAVYADFARQYPRARGVGAVRGAAQLALRTQATVTARAALARESTLTAAPPEPASLAVLPLTIAGDSAFQPLSRGLAELLTADLALVRSLRLLERVQIGALLDELQLGQTDRADPATAARVGRLLRAERMVQGVAAIDPRGPVRLTASIVAADGSTRSGAQAGGRFQDLLDLEKQLVFGLAEQLGIALTAAERRRILREGTRSLAAFLAYSDGLDALDRGDYRAAAGAFAAALRADPEFRAAREHHDAAEAAPAVQQAPDVVTGVEAAIDLARPLERVSSGALRSANDDLLPPLLAPVESGTTAVRSEPTTDSQGVTSVLQASGVLRIIFRRP